MRSVNLELSVTKGGREGKSKLAVSNVLGMDSKIGYHGIDKRTSAKKLRSKEAKRRAVLKRRVGIVKKRKVFQRHYLRNGTEKLISMVLVPARIWEHKSLGVCTSQRLKMRRHVAEIPGKKTTEIENMEMEHDFVYSATFYRVKSCGLKMCVMLGERSSLRQDRGIRFVDLREPHAAS